MPQVAEGVITKVFNKEENSSYCIPTLQVGFEMFSEISV